MDSTQDIFGAPTLNENVSGGLVAELWEKVKAGQWRVFTADDRALPLLIETFVHHEATCWDLLHRRQAGGDPIGSFLWRSEAGVRHEGAVWLNGSVYRQVRPDGSALLMLMVDTDTAQRLEARCRQP